MTESRVWAPSGVVADAGATAARAMTPTRGSRPDPSRVACVTRRTWSALGARSLMRPRARALGGEPEAHLGAAPHPADLEGVGQRAHDDEPAPALGGERRRRGNPEGARGARAPAVGHSDLSVIGGGSDLDLDALAGDRAVLDRVGQGLADCEHDEFRGLLLPPLAPERAAHGVAPGGERPEVGRKAQARTPVGTAGTDRLDGGAAWAWRCPCLLRVRPVRRGAPFTQG